MQTFKSLNEVQEADLSPAVRNIVLWCVLSLIDAYGPDFDADEVGGVVLLDRDITDDDAYELFGRTWVRDCTRGSRTMNLPAAT